MTIVVFTIVRLLVARGTLGKYGLNVWIFGAIDLITAVPYALGMARVVISIVDRQLRAASWWIALTAVSFLAPYVYIAWAGREAQFPMVVYIALVVLMVFFALHAVWTVAKKVRARTVRPRTASAAGAHGEDALALGEFVADGASGAAGLLAEALLSGSPKAADRDRNSDAGRR